VQAFKDAPMRKVLGVGFKRIGGIIKKGEEREREREREKERRRQRESKRRKARKRARDLLDSKLSLY
jgi:hypothetical protein